MSLTSGYSGRLQTPCYIEDLLYRMLLTSPPVTLPKLNKRTHIRGFTATRSKASLALTTVRINALQSNLRKLRIFTNKFSAVYKYELVSLHCFNELISSSFVSTLGVRIPSSVVPKYFYFLLNVQTGSGANLAPYTMANATISTGVNLTSHLHLVPRLRIMERYCVILNSCRGFRGL
jgi:hypothetical protein